jgi:hypothetical protein
MNDKVDLIALAILVKKTKETKGLTILVTNKGIGDLLVLNQGRIISMDYSSLAFVLIELKDGEDNFTDIDYLNSTIEQLIKWDGESITYDYEGEYQV